MASPIDEEEAMSTTTPATPTTTAAIGTRSIPLALAVVGAVFAVNGLVLGAPILLDDQRAYSEVVTGPAHLVHYAVWTACLVALSQLYPRLATVSYDPAVREGRSSAGVPVAVATVAGIGAALEGCARFVSAFVTPYLAAHDPALVDNPPDPILLVPLLGAGVVAMVATATLAVVAWRRRVIPVAAAALLLVGAVAIPVLGPVSNVLVGAALAWIGLHLGRAPRV